jgi:hypothetical protein
MIDFVRFELRDRLKQQFELRCLELQELDDVLKETLGIGVLEQKFDKYTNQISEYPLFMNVHNMKIKISLNIARVEGSLHKLHNIRSTKVNHNSNEFLKSQICNNLEFLNDIFPCIASAKITCLEFGLNINPPEESKTIICEKLYLHKENLPQGSILNGSKIYKEFSYEEYDLKIYDKARQYRYLACESEILRLELRLRNRALRNHNIKNIDDLKIIENLKGLFSTYIQRIQELRIIDSYHDSKVPVIDKKLLDNYISEAYWRRLRKSEHPQKIKRLRYQAENLIQEYALDSSKKKLIDLLKLRFQHLIST